MYLVVAFAITLMVIALAWRGLGATRPSDGEGGGSERPARAPHPPKSGPRRVVAPDDDPDFLSEIDRRLRDEGKNNN